MSERNKYKTEKLGHDEKKKKADLERRIGVPDPPVPNRAHTELSRHDHAEMSIRDRTEMSERGLDDFHLTETSTQPFGDSAFYVNTKKHRSGEENAKKHMETE